MLARNSSLILFAILLSPLLPAQKSDLYLVDLLKTDGRYEIRHPRLLSGFNSAGYTNQPHFVGTNNLLVTAGPANDLLNTDIYQLDFRTRKLTRVTRTSDREYSPALSRSDGQWVNCVIVEVENSDQQILWQYPLDRSGGGRPFLKQLKDVAYYCEMPAGWVAVFELGTPNKLWLVHRETGDKKFVSSSPGRTLQLSKTGELVYVHKFSEDYWFLKKFNPGTMTSEILKKTLPGSEDFTILPDDSILMGQDSKLFRLDPETTQWQEIANLEDYDIHHIKRLAFNGVNQLAIVNQP